MGDIINSKVVIVAIIAILVVCVGVYAYYTTISNNEVITLLMGLILQIIVQIVVLIPIILQLAM